MTMIRNGLRTRPKGSRAASAGAASGIDADLVRTLATLIADTDLAELEIEKGDLRIKLVRHTAMTLAAAPAGPTTVLAVPAASGGGAFAPAAEQPKPADHPGTVKSPMVGTVYRRASPESRPFVEVGSAVKAGEKILLVEAMKTFNEIVAPRAGTIAAVLVEDGQPVEFGQPLLVIE